MTDIPTDTCGECNRLWQELSHAAVAYVKLCRQHKRLAIRPNLIGIPVFKRQLTDAAEMRNIARNALKDHEAAHRLGPR